LAGACFAGMVDRMNAPAPTATLHYPILSTGSALPSRVIANADLMAMGVDTNDAWIVSRTGIRQRHWCGDGESTGTLALAAARQALARAKVDDSRVAVLLVATCTPDRTFPSVAAHLHGQLGLPKHCVVLDVNAACSGFVHALGVAQALLRPGQVALVVGAERFSNLLDLTDRSTCVLFGDGAGAMVLGCEALPSGQLPRGLLGVQLGADGAQEASLFSSGGPGTTRTAGTVQMQGQEVFRHAVRQMGQVPELLKQHGLTLADVQWLVPHQANVRILEAAREALGLRAEQVVVTVAEHANTSGASIPLALDNARARFKTGDVLLLQAFGAGFVWGSALIRW